MGRCLQKVPLKHRNQIAAQCAGASAACIREHRLVDTADSHTATQHVCRDGDLPKSIHPHRAIVESLNSAVFCRLTWCKQNFLVSAANPHAGIHFEVSWFVCGMLSKGTDQRVKELYSSGARPTGRHSHSLTHTHRHTFTPDNPLVHKHRSLSALTRRSVAQHRDPVGFDIKIKA